MKQAFSYQKSCIFTMNSTYSHIIYSVNTKCTNIFTLKSKPQCKKYKALQKLGHFCYIFYTKYCHAVFLPTSPWGREEIALFASVVLYSLCTTLVNFTLQLPQLPEAYFELQCPPRLLSGPGRTAVPTAPSPCRTARCIHLLSSFHSHCLKGSNIGSSSQE